MQNKNILVVGASKGIGLAIANYLDENGYNICAVARSKRPSQLNKSIIYKKFDVTKNYDKSKFDFIPGSNFDGIVYCVGISISKGLLSEVDRYYKTIFMNLICPFNFLINTYKFTKAQSSIILLSSINSQQAFSDNPGYVASKAGLDGLTRALALDFNSKKIRVNSIVLGYFHTEMTANSFNDTNKKKARSDRTILNRWGDLTEVSPVVEFLLSDKSSYITGESIAVDGGWLAKGI